MSGNATTSGRRAKFTEERDAARKREEFRYGCMAREKPAQWPDWMLNPAALPKAPPSGRRIGS